MSMRFRCNLVHLGGIKHLTAVPSSKDAVNQSLLSCILYPGVGDIFCFNGSLYVMVSLRKNNLTLT